MIPSNPMTPERQEKMKKILKEALDIFALNYLRATKNVVKEKKEKELEEEDEKKKKEEEFKKKQERYWEKKHPSEDFPGLPEKEGLLEDMDYNKIKEYELSLFDKGLKAKRPKPKREKEKPTEIQIKISRYQLVDEQTDPYCVYYIESTLGDKEASVYHRYTDFKNLDKKIRKILPKEAVLPKQSSAFGSRNLDEEFLKERCETLLAYLTEISKVDNITDQKDYMDFLDLSERANPLDRPIFDESLKLTKTELKIKEDLIYDTEEAGVARLIICKIQKELMPELEKDLPTNDAIRSKVVKGIYKTINTTVNTAVPPVWKTAYEASTPVRDTIINLMNTVLGKFLELKKELIDAINDACEEALKPVKEAISAALSSLLVYVIPLIIKAFSPFINIFKLTIEPAIKKAIEQDDKTDISEIGNCFNKTKDEIKQKLQEQLDKAINDKCDEIHISVDALLDLFSPIKNLVKLLNTLLGGLLDPLNWVIIFEELLKQKEQLKTKSNMSEEELKNELDRLEDDISSKIERRGVFISWAASEVRYCLNSCGINLKKVPDKIYSACIEMKDKLHKEVLERYYESFSDHIWVPVVCEKNTNWEQILNDAFRAGYLSAKKKFLRNIGVLIKKLINNILSGAIIDNIVDLVKKGTEKTIKPLEEKIPTDLQDLFDISDTLVKLIEDNLTKILEGVIDDQEKLFIEEYEKFQ